MVTAGIITSVIITAVREEPPDLGYCQISTPTPPFATLVKLDGMGGEGLLKSNLSMGSIPIGKLVTNHCFAY